MTSHRYFGFTSLQSTVYHLLHCQGYQMQLKYLWHLRMFFIFYLIYAYVFIYMCVIYVYSVSSSSYRETEKHIAENRHIHVLIIVKKSYLLNS